MGADLRVIGERIEALLDQVRAAPTPRFGDAAEELVRLVTELYGAGLARVVELVPDRLDVLLEDELVGALLALHGLHPLELKARVEGALESVRPMLGHHAGDVELLDLDEAAGAVFLRLLGSCDGCPSSTVTLQNAVYKAIVEAAPEISIIDVEDTSAPHDDGSVPVTLGRKVQFDDCPTELVHG
jgi:Fe-S cluster biogenesis protein NfuA